MSNITKKPHGNINFEIKTACGRLDFKKNSLVIYAPAPCATNIANNSYVFTVESFMEMLEGYKTSKGACGFIRGNNIQSFHWTDVDGNEYRPKASSKLERYLREALSYQPTVKELFDALEISTEGLDEELKQTYEARLAKNPTYGGNFGDAFEAALRKRLAPSAKKYYWHAPAGRVDCNVQKKIRKQELLDLLGI